MEINVSTKLAGVGSRGRRRDPVPALRKRLGELLLPGECEETVQIVRNFALSSLTWAPSGSRFNETVPVDSDAR